MAKLPNLPNPQSLKCHNEVVRLLLTNGTALSLKFSQTSRKVKQVEHNVSDFCISGNRVFYLRDDGSVTVEIGGEGTTTLRVGTLSMQNASLVCANGVVGVLTGNTIVRLDQHTF